jgi:hypothetical protein
MCLWIIQSRSKTEKKRNRKTIEIKKGDKKGFKKGGDSAWC